MRRGECARGGAQGGGALLALKKKEQQTLPKTEKCVFDPFLAILRENGDFFFREPPAIEWRHQKHQFEARNDGF